MSFPVKGVSVQRTIVNDFSVKLPRSSQQQVADIHRGDVTVCAIFVEFSNRESHQSTMCDAYVDSLVKPTQCIRRRMRFSCEAKLGDCLLRDYIGTASRINDERAKTVFDDAG